MKNDELDIIIDLSHWNESVDFKKIKFFGIQGVIHKATEGFKYVDKNYIQRKEMAIDTGLFWGAYHFGISGDGDMQADNFLNTVNPENHILTVLDIEENPNGSNMDIDEAEEFVSYVYQHTGRWPGIYSSTRHLKNMLGNDISSPLTNCWLWLARWSSAKPIVPRGWQEWKLWQHTDGDKGYNPTPVDGVGRCDRSIFNGDQKDFLAFWKN